MTNVFQRDHYDGVARELAPWPPPRLDTITFPWEVPEETIVVEFDGEFWRVVPHRGFVRMFRTREEALEWARARAALYLNMWRIVEYPPVAESRRRSA